MKNFKKRFFTILVTWLIFHVSVVGLGVIFFNADFKESLTIEVFVVSIIVGFIFDSLLIAARNTD